MAEGNGETPDELTSVACSHCFKNRGLILDAMQYGREESGACPNCGHKEGIKLGRAALAFLANRFFVDGSFRKCDFGGAPLIQFNEHQETSIQVDDVLKEDIGVFENVLGIGFFDYGPRLWMVGEVEPLKSLLDEKKRDTVIERILTEYPTKTLGLTESFYRVRKSPTSAIDPREYDTPPASITQNGRLSSNDVPVMYASPLIDLCVHECRYTIEDELFVASLNPTRELRLLDLTAVLEEEVTEFESLDMAVHMLFLGDRLAYDVTRVIARAAHKKGFDGLVYPSYFSSHYRGERPLQTVYGLTRRLFKRFKSYEQSLSVPNLALFGYPIADGMVEVDTINRLVISRVCYEFHHGPALA
ncbi:MAG: RES family NAD+ phosphorylase [Lysobacteraceae bacterium]